MRLASLLPLLALASFCAAPGVLADTVTLKDGSVLKGKLQGIEGGVLSFKSESAAEPIKLKQADVTGFSTDTEVMMAMASQTQVKGKVEAGEAGRVKVATSESTSSFKVENIKDVWLADTPSPSERAMEKLRRRWEYTADVSALGKTGNRESVAISTGLQALLKSPEDETLFYAKHNYAKTKGPLGWVKSADDLHAGLEYTSYFDRPNFWYVRSDNGYDKVRLINFFSTDAAGVGRLLIDKPNQHLALRAGLSYRFESYKNNIRDDTSAPGLDVGVHHDCEFKYFKMVNDLTYTPAFNEFTHNYIILHDSYIEMPLSRSDSWSLRLGMANEYRSKVLPGVDRLDSTYYLKFALRWK